MSINIENMNEVEQVDTSIDTNKKIKGKKSDSKSKSKGLDMSVSEAVIFADSKVEEFAFGGIARKLKIASKAILYIFMVLGLIGLVLTVMLTSSLGGFGVIVALCMLGLFIFVGYLLSSLIYGYSVVVENSEKKVAASEPIIMQVPVQTAVAKSEDQDEFPEF